MQAQPLALSLTRQLRFHRPNLHLYSLSRRSLDNKNKRKDAAEQLLTGAAVVEGVAAQEEPNKVGNEEEVNEA